MNETVKTHPPVETERKYLIAYPDTAMLRSLPDVQVWNIVQIYLCASSGVTARIRMVEENGALRYIYTEKRRISALSSYESEREVDEAEYVRLSRMADDRLQPVKKTRYRFSFRGFCMEVDVYPFWQDRAILEIELPSETVQPPIPEYLHVLSDVTGEKRYSNRSLAESVPFDKVF